MPKLIHSDPKLCPFKGGKQSVAYLPDPPAKRPVRKVIRHPFGSSEARIEYHTLLAEWRRNGCRASAIPLKRDPSVGPLSVAELCAHVWIHAKKSWKKADGKPNVRCERLGYLIQRLRVYDDRPAESLGLAEVQGIANTMAEEGLAKDTYKKRLSSLNDLVSLAVGLSHLTPETRTRVKGACAALRRTPPTGLADAREVDAVDDEVVNATLPALPPNAADAIVLARRCGARASEITTLRVREIKQTKIKQKPVWFFERKTQHKTAHHQHVMRRYFDAEAQTLLMPYLERRRPEELVFSRAEDEAWRRERRPRTTPLNSGNRPGYTAATRAGKTPRRCAEGYTDDSLYRAVERACKTVGINRWHPHQLRHSAAVEFGAVHGEQDAMAMLGQKSVAIFRRYSQKQKSQHESALHAVAGVKYSPKKFKPRPRHDGNSAVDA